MKLRTNSLKEENDLFLALMRLLEKQNVLRIVEQSKPYPNRGANIAERVYLDVMLNPAIATLVQKQLNGANSPDIAKGQFSMFGGSND